MDNGETVSKIRTNLKKDTKIHKKTLYHVSNRCFMYKELIKI